MTPKKLIQDFYKSDALINAVIMDTYLHPEFEMEWHSSKGFIEMDREKALAITKELESAYIRSKARLTHLIQEGNTVSVRYSHYVKTIENPREEMLLAHFFVIWEIKDDKLHRAYQMSQLS